MKKLILAMMGEQVKLLSLQQDKVIASNRKANCQKPPYHFLVTSLTERAYNILLAYPVISTKDAMAFIIPYTLLTPHFLLSIEGFTLGISDLSTVQDVEYKVTRVV